MPIRVRATDVGWSGLKLVAIGEEFEISEESAFSPEWMERVDETSPEASEPSPEVAPKRKAGRPPKAQAVI